MRFDKYEKEALTYSYKALKRNVPLWVSRLDDIKCLLQASVKKYVPFDTAYIDFPDELECYDSLSFRFGKCVEIAIHFFGSLELFTFAKQSDTLRDRLLVMQKINIIGEIDFWMEARLLRNKIAHAYLPEEIKDIYQEIHDSSQEIFNTIDRIKNYLAEQAKKEKDEQK